MIIKNGSVFQEDGTFKKCDVYIRIKGKWMPADFW